MPRIRSLKPEIWDDEALGACTRDARLLFVGLITQADDSGRFRAAPALLRASIFPYDEKLTKDRVEVWIDELADAGLVSLYTVKRERYGEFPTWSSHQKIDRPSESKIPSIGAPDAVPTIKTGDPYARCSPASADNTVTGQLDESSNPLNGARNPASLKDSTSPRRVLDEPSTLEGRGKERKGSGRESSFEATYNHWQRQPGLIHHRKPTPAMRRAHATALKNHDQPDIHQAVELYATVLASSKHWFTYSWTFEEFLKRGVDKFVPEVQPLTRYFGAGPNGNGSREPAERDPQASLRRDTDRCRTIYKAALAQGMSESDARAEAAGFYSDAIVQEATA